VLAKALSPDCPGLAAHLNLVTITCNSEWSVE